MNENRSITNVARDYGAGAGQTAIPEPTRAIPGAIENLHHAVSDVQGAVSNLLRRLENLSPGGLGGVKADGTEKPRTVRSHVCDQICNATDALRMLASEVAAATERIEV